MPLTAREIFVHSGYLLGLFLALMGMRALRTNGARANLICAAGVIVIVVFALYEKGHFTNIFVLGSLFFGMTCGAFLNYRNVQTADRYSCVLHSSLSGGASLLAGFAIFLAAAKTGSLIDLDLRGQHGFGPALILALSIFLAGITCSGSFAIWLKLSNANTHKLDTWFESKAGNALFAVFTIILNVAWFAFVETPLLSIICGLLVLLTALTLGVRFGLRVRPDAVPGVLGLLNGCAGLAAAAAGFILAEYTLIAAGALIAGGGFSSSFR